MVSSQGDSCDVENVATGLSQAAVRDTIGVKPKGTPSKELDLSEKAHAEESSEFGDDDLDLDMIEAAHGDGEDNLVMGELPNQDTHVVNHQPDGKVQELDCSVRSQSTPVAINSYQATGYTSQQQGQPSRLPTNENDAYKDEFDDEDADEFAADLDDVCAKYDSQPSAPNTRSMEPRRPDQITANRTDPSLSGPPQNIQRSIEVVSDDEDFGDDSDFEQIAAECAQATQDQTLGSPSQSIVCAFRPRRFNSVG